MSRAINKSKLKTSQIFSLSASAKIGRLDQALENVRKDLSNERTARGLADSDFDFMIKTDHDAPKKSVLAVGVMHSILDSGRSFYFKTPAYDCATGNPVSNPEWGTSPSLPTGQDFLQSIWREEDGEAKRLGIGYLGIAPDSSVEAVVNFIHPRPGNKSYISEWDDVAAEMIQLLNHRFGE